MADVDGRQPAPPGCVVVVQSWFPFLSLFPSLFLPTLLLLLLLLVCCYVLMLCCVVVVVAIFCMHGSPAAQTVI